MEGKLADINTGIMITQAKSNYPYSILHKKISFYRSHSIDPINIIILNLLSLI
jgi:hypothetical protein